MMIFSTYPRKLGIFGNHVLIGNSKGTQTLSVSTTTEPKQACYDFGCYLEVADVSERIEKLQDRGIIRRWN